VALFSNQKEALKDIHRAQNVRQSGPPRDFVHRVETSPLATDKKAMWELDMHVKMEEKGLVGTLCIVPKAHLKAIKAKGCKFIKCGTCNHKMHGPILVKAGGHIRLYEREGTAASRPYLVDGIMTWCSLECYDVYCINFPHQMCTDPKRMGDVHVPRDMAIAAGVSSACLSVWSNKIQAGPSYMEGLSYLEVLVGDNHWEPVRGAGAARRSVAVLDRHLFQVGDHTTVSKWLEGGVVYRDAHVQYPVMLRLIGQVA
jgi:hypothetical protein